MKRAPLFITIGLIALSVGGYFVYHHFFVKHDISPWELVPGSAVVVYETNACTECQDKARTSSLWETIRRASVFEKKQDSLRQLVGILSTPRNGSLASLHVTKKDDFDFIYYMPIRSENEQKLLEATIQEWKGKFRFTERVFNDVTIRELSSGETVFSFVQLDNVLAASFTPFLVEDVIRTYGESDSFRKEIATVYQMPTMKNDAGNLYIQLTNFSAWLSVFSPGVDLDIIEHFGKAGLLDVKVDESNIVLNGFSSEDPKTITALSVFSGQSPTSFSLKSYISNRTVTLVSYGISDGEQFGKSLNAYPERSQAVRDTLSRLGKGLNVDFNTLYSAIDDEVGLCYVESGGQKLSTVLLVEVSDAERWLSVFNTASEKLSEDTVFFERFSGYEIRELPVYRFPEKLLSPFVTGFDQTYYTTIGNTFIIGENLEQLKSFLEDIDREDTWGKSVAQNRFLESTLLESNISLYINTPRIWNVLTGVLSEKWNKFVVSNRPLLSSAGMGAVQFSHLNESFYTNISWQYKEPPLAEAQQPEKTEMIVTAFNTTLSGKPYVVRSHVDKTMEVFLQDSLNRIHLVSADGNVLWSKTLLGPVIGEVFQVDYYKNGKLQYFFATPGSLHIIDRLGNYVESYPVAIQPKEIEHVSLVDYDHSKNYRFLIADKSGKIWMYDKEGINLDGWKPRNVEDGLAMPPRHHRIRGKDYIIAIRRDGKVYLMNRRGEVLKGFPLDLDARPVGDYFLEIGKRVEETFFVVVARDGFRIKFDLNGKVHTRETLLKTSVDAHFSLVREATGKSYVMVRQEGKGVTLLDDEGKDFIVNDYIALNQASVQYYDFGAGKIYYIITDHTQDLAYVYDGRGNLLSSPPFECYEASLYPANSDKVKIYLTYRKSLYIKPLL